MVEEARVLGRQHRLDEMIRQFLERHRVVLLDAAGADIGAVAVDGLAGQLGHQLWLGDGVEDAARAAGGPILRQRPASLAHEPHRHVGNALAATGLDEGSIVEAAGNGRGLAR